MPKALVILSGGQDSTVCLYWAKDQGYEVHAVTFDYGQRHRAEIEAAKKVAEMAEVASHQIVTIGPILQGRSPLTNNGVELETYSSYWQMEETIGDRIEKTFVPMRNSLFLTLTANLSVCMDCYTVVTGVCDDDTLNYPDCREEFIDAQQKAINEALGIINFKIKTPLLHMSKAENIDLAIKLPGAMEALAFTHTAYDGNYPPTSKDHASVLRAQGFEDAGVPDPLVVRAWREGLMNLPETENYRGIDRD